MGTPTHSWEYVNNWRRSLPRMAQRNSNSCGSGMSWGMKLFRVSNCFPIFAEQEKAEEVGKRDNKCWQSPVDNKWRCSPPLPCIHRRVSFFYRQPTFDFATAIIHAWRARIEMSTQVWRRATQRRGRESEESYVGLLRHSTVTDVSCTNAL